MCNFIHQDSRPIPKRGIGWKLFICDKNDQLKSLVDHAFYAKDKYDKAFWNPYHAGNGFCFFLTEKEALRAKSLWEQTAQSEPCSIAKITYCGGIEQHKERCFVSGKVFNIALCKGFRLHPKEKYIL